MLVREQWDWKGSEWLGSHAWEGSGRGSVDMICPLVQKLLSLTSAYPHEYRAFCYSL